MSNDCRRKAVWGSRVRLGLLLLSAFTLPSCSEAIRTGQSPAYLILNSLTGTAGGPGGTSSAFLLSDVVTVVNGSPTFFNDVGTATLELVMKDPIGTSPSPVNAITITQYHVRYFRTDGRNVEGVDVPYAFSGAVTQTVSGTAGVPFILVRHQAKLEAPLAALANNLQIISTIAEVTFFGHDQNGREVTVSGRIDVAFSNYGD